MNWTFLYLMLFLKLPIAGLLWIVWWAIHAEPESETDEQGSDDGGSKRPVHPRGPAARTSPPARPARRSPAPGARRARAAPVSARARRVSRP